MNKDMLVHDDTETVTGVEGDEDKYAIIILSSSSRSVSKFSTMLPLSELTAESFSEWVRLKSRVILASTDCFDFINFDEIISRQLTSDHPTILNYAGLSIILRFRSLIDLNFDSGFNLGKLNFYPTTIRHLTFSTTPDQKGYLAIGKDGRVAATMDPDYEVHDFVVDIERNFISSDCDIFTYHQSSGSLIIKPLE